MEEHVLQGRLAYRNGLDLIAEVLHQLIDQPVSLAVLELNGTVEDDWFT